MVKGCRTEQRYLIGRPPDVFERLFHVRGEEEVRVWTERMGQKCAVPSFDGGPLLSKPLPSSSGPYIFNKIR